MPTPAKPATPDPRDPDGRLPRAQLEVAEIFGNIAAFWGFTLAMMIGGPLCDVLGMGRLISFAFVGHLAGILLTIFAQGFGTLYAGTLLIGLANGFVEQFELTTNCLRCEVQNFRGLRHAPLTRDGPEVLQVAVVEVAHGHIISGRIIQSEYSVLPNIQLTVSLSTQG